MSGVGTTYLGQFTDEHAEAIAERLEKAGITWYHKRSGGVTRLLFRSEWGVRLFVDAASLDEARAIACAITGEGGAKHRS